MKTSARSLALVLGVLLFITAIPRESSIAQTITSDSAVAAGDGANSPSLALDRDAFVGIWREKTTGRPLVIEPLHPDELAKAEEIKALTQNRRNVEPLGWGGIIFSAASDKPSHIRLQTAPRVEDMNKALPDWVRRQIVNTLRWELDLEQDPDFPFNPRLKGKFYPGEVQWSDGTGGTEGTAKVIGMGNPVDLTYEPDGDIPIEAIHAPIIELEFPGHTPFSATEIRYVLKGDSFRTRVTLPQTEAKQQGLKLQLKFSGKTSGGEASVELETVEPQLKGITARYTHPDLITIDNPGKAQNREPLFGLFPPATGFGPRLSLNARNGEEVELSAAGATYRFRVFDNPIELALARRIDGIQDLAFIWSAKLASSAGNEIKEDAVRRLRMTRTALEIGVDEKLASEVRLAVLDTYLSSGGQSGLLLAATDLGWIPASDPDSAKPNRWGTLWASYVEAIDVDGPQTAEQIKFFRSLPWDSQEHLLNGDPPIIGSLRVAERDYKKKLNHAFLGFYRDSVFAIYNIYVEQTAGEQFMRAIYGIDRMGHEVSLGDKVMGLFEIYTQLKMPGVIETLTNQGPIRRTLPRSVEGDAVNVPLPGTPPGASLPPEMKPSLHYPATGNKQVAALPTTPPPPLPTAPAPLPKLPATKENTPIVTGPFMQPRKPTPIECTYPANPMAGARTPGNPKAAFKVDPTGTLNNTAITGEKILDFDDTFAQQVDKNSCTAAAIAKAFGDKDIDITQEKIIRDILLSRGTLKPNQAGLADLGYGIDYKEAAVFFKSANIPHQTSEFKPEIFRSMKEFYDQGFDVVVHVRYPTGNHHSLHIEKFVLDADGRVTAVRFFDPGPGDTRELSARVFTDYVRAAATANKNRGLYMLAFMVPTK